MDKRVAQTAAIGAVLIALLLALVDTETPADGSAAYAPAEDAPTWAAAVEAGQDHVTPEALADLLLEKPDGVLVIDVRPPEEYAGFHLPGSVNLDLVDLLGPRGTALLDAHAGQTTVLVSNGMTHPAQAWVALTQAGRGNVRILEDGLTGFRQRILIPPSLRGPTTRGRAAAEGARFRAFQGLLAGRTGAR